MVNPYLNKGGCYYELKKYDEAINNLDMAINLDPSNYQAYNNKGLVYLA